MELSRSIAIDVVLLPPAAINAWAVACNRSLLAHSPEGFALDLTHLPHLTLVQQCVPIESLNRVYATVEAVATRLDPLHLQITGCQRVGSTCSATVARTPELLKLHVRLVAELATMAEPTVPELSFLSAGERPRPRDIEWVARFHRDASGDRYDPHITLGVGPAPVLEHPLPFVVDHLAVCHLGRYCTCRKVLAEWKLDG